MQSQPRDSSCAGLPGTPQIVTVAPSTCTAAEVLRTVTVTP
jgi:hypothetical protein